MQNKFIKKLNSTEIQVLDIALFFWAILFGDFIFPVLSSEINPDGILNPRESNQSVLLGIIMLSSVVLLAISIIFSPGRPAKMFSENYMKKTEAEKKELNRNTLRAVPLGLGAIMFTVYSTYHLFDQTTGGMNIISVWSVILVFVFVRGKPLNPNIRKLLTIPYILISAIGLELFFTNYVARADIRIGDFILASPFIPIYYAAFIFGPRWISGDKSKFLAWVIRFAIFYAGLFLSFL